MISDFMMLFYFGFTVWTDFTHILDNNCFRQQTTLFILEQQYIFDNLLTYLILGMYMHIYLVFGSHKCVLKYFM
jgi:hypothetical protein